MIRTLQRKFVVTAMIAVTVLLAVLLGVINVVNAVTQQAENDGMLDMLASLEDFGPTPFEDDARQEPRGFRRISGYGAYAPQAVKGPGVF